MLAAAPPTPNDAHRFLDILSQGQGGPFCFRSFDDNKDRRAKTLVRTYKHAALEDIQDELQQVNDLGAGVFVTINVTDGAGLAADNVTGARAVFVDLDGAPLANVTESDWLTPDIVVETSPERFHCYWLVDADFPIDQFTPVQKALAAKFGGDAVVIDRSRVMRLPGFCHAKGEAAFQSRIVSVSGRAFSYSYDELAPGLGLGGPVGPVADVKKGTFEDFAGRSDATIEQARDMLEHIEPDGGDYDHWLDCLMAIHHQFGAEGLALAEEWNQRSIQYSAGEVAAKFKSFDRTTTSGVTIATLAAKARDGGANLSALSRQHRDAERLQDAGAIDLSDYVLMSSGNYYQISTNTEYSGPALNAFWQHIHTGGRGDPKAATLFNANPGKQTAQGVTWMPKPYGCDSDRFIEHESKILVNTWYGYPITPKAGDVAPWFDLAAHLFPDAEQCENVIDRIAFDIQHPDQKCEWSLVMVGVQNAGKNLFMQPISKIFGRAFGSIGNSEIKGTYDDAWAGRKIIEMNEASALRGDTLEKIKQRTSSQGSEMAKLNIKSSGQIDHPAIWSVYFTTNNKDALDITEDDRRFYITYSPDKVLAAQSDLVGEWLAGSGSAALFDYLLRRDLAGFNFRQLPAKTAAMYAMIEDSKPDYHQTIEEWQVTGAHGFDKGLVNAKDLHDVLKSKGERCTLAKVRSSLELLGWPKVRDIDRAIKKEGGKVTRKSRQYHAEVTGYFHDLEGAELHSAIDEVEKSGNFTKTELG